MVYGRKGGQEKVESSGGARVAGVYRTTIRRCKNIRDVTPLFWSNMVDDNETLDIYGFVISVAGLQTRRYRECNKTSKPMKVERGPLKPRESQM